jgi:hypothetical protein
MRFLAAMLGALVISVCGIQSAHGVPPAPPSVPCTISAGVFQNTSSNGTLVKGVCLPVPKATGSGPSDGSVSTSLTIDCGVPGNTENIGSAKWNLKACGPDTIACTAGPSDNPKVPLHAFITRTTTTDASGNQTVTDSALWCGHAQKPQPTLVDLRQAALKLLPKPGIGVAGKGTTLVNLQTIMWLDTPANRKLGSATVVGTRVQIRAHLSSVAWDFGDDTADMATEPGKPYGHPDTCDQIVCDEFFGHIYTTRTGATTITATPTWFAEYSVDNSNWLPITPDIPGTTVTTQITIRQAHAVLVPNPEHS